MNKHNQINSFTNTSPKISNFNKLTSNNNINQNYYNQQYNYSPVSDISSKTQRYVNHSNLKNPYNLKINIEENKKNNNFGLMKSTNSPKIQITQNLDNPYNNYYNSGFKKINQYNENGGNYQNPVYNQDNEYNNNYYSPNNDKENNYERFENKDIPDYIKKENEKNKNLNNSTFFKNYTEHWIKVSNF